MHEKPNYELLKDAYAVIAGIPNDQFRLHYIFTHKPTEDPSYCGTIGCAMGWLSLHPTFAQLLGARNKFGQRCNGLDAIRWTKPGTSISTNYYAGAAAWAFGISVTQARNLFTKAGGSHYDRGILEFNGGTLPNDKRLCLARIEAFLKSRNQWKGLPA